MRWDEGGRSGAAKGWVGVTRDAMGPPGMPIESLRDAYVATRDAMGPLRDGLGPPGTPMESLGNGLGTPGLLWGHQGRLWSP